LIFIISVVLKVKLVKVKVKLYGVMAPIRIFPCNPTKPSFILCLEMQIW